MMKAWLYCLIKQLLYSNKHITVDWCVFKQSMRDSAVPVKVDICDRNYEETIGALDANRAPGSKLILER